MLLTVRRARLRFLRPVRWDWFGTFTVTRSVRNGDEERRWLWNEFLARVRAEHHDTLGYVYAEERRSGAGVLSRINLHFHVLFVSNRPLDRRMLRRKWAELAGNASAAAEIEPYDPSRRGLGYMLKLVDRDDSNWQISDGVAFFRPEQPQGTDCRSRRRYRRHVKRASSTSGIEPVPPAWSGGPSWAPAAPR